MDEKSRAKIIAHFKSLQDAGKLTGASILSVIGTVEEKAKKDCLKKVKSLLDSLK